MEEKLEAKVEKLEVNRDLINTNFQSYRLNRDVKHTVLSKSFPSGHKIQSLKLGNSDYSYCHTSMSSNINNLYYDRFNPHQVYFVTDAGSVLGSFLSTEQEVNTIKFDLKNVFTIPDFNCNLMYASLSFPSPRNAIVLLSSKCTKKFAVEKPNNSIEYIERNEYCVKLFILDRNSVDNGGTWTIDGTLNVSQGFLYSCLNLASSSHFHLYDSSLLNNNLNAQSIVIGSVNECFQISLQNNSNQLKSRFNAVFHQIELRKNNPNSNQWSIYENNRFIEVSRAANDFPKYVALGNANDILIISQSRMNYSKVEDGYNGINNTFYVKQTDDYMTLQLNLDNLKIGLDKVDIDKLNFDVVFDSTRLDIKISLLHHERPFLILAGELEQSINPDESDYKIVPQSKDCPNLLEMKLKKQNTDQPWRGNVVHINKSTIINCRIDYEDCIFLSAEVQDDQQMTEDDKATEICREDTEEHMKAEFTKAVFDEYENCDLHDSVSSLVLTRFERNTGKVLNEYDLSSTQWLFSIANYSTNNRLPYFVTRHDVDAFVYEPRSETTTVDGNDLNRFEVKHLDSFPAFGYVYASKQNRRFMTFGQELNAQKTQWNYAVIDNWIDRLLYIYNKPEADPSNDQNATKPCFGQQFLFHFDENEVSSKGRKPMITYGLYATPSLTDSILAKHQKKCAIYILCDEKLHLVLF